MSLGTDILFLLEASPGLTSGELSERLGKPEPEVRTCLLTALRPFTTKDWFGKWYLQEQLNLPDHVWPSPPKLRALIRETHDRAQTAPDAEGEGVPEIDIASQLSTWVRDAQRWAMFEGRPTTLGNLLTPGAAELPPDLACRLEDLYERSTSRPAAMPPDPFEPILIWFRSLDDRRKSILTRRTLVFGRGEILENLAAEFGVTRERVRQLEKGLTDDFERWARSWEWQPTTWRAHTLRQAAGLTCPQSDHEVESCFSGLSTSSEEEHTVVTAALWRLAGPYQLEEDGWLILDGDSLGSLRQRLSTPGDGRAFLTAEEAAGVAEEAGLRPVFFESWVNKEARLRLLDGHIVPWSPFIGDRVEVVLRLSGRPMTADALFGAIGDDTDERALRGRLSTDRRFARSSVVEWALADWEMPEYQGIAQAISGLLDETQAPMRINDVVARLCSSLGLAESSVRALCGAPRFVLEDGYVRPRRVDEPFPVKSNIAPAQGVFRKAPHCASLLLTVDEQLLKGSGRAIPEPIASILSLLPGGDEEFECGDSPIRVSWPDTSVSGPAIGSVRVHAEELGAQLGDVLRIELDGEACTASVHRVIPNDLQHAPVAERVRALTGLTPAGDTDGVLESLAFAMGTSTGEVRQSLQQRGDTWILPVLPVEPTPKGLDEAIDELGKLLDE